MASFGLERVLVEVPDAEREQNRLAHGDSTRGQLRDPRRFR